ncbi:hypothetical protein [Inquilinus limosus]|uniref:hypothetical protein n=1 Tax=Inquilinus limosus TaxID=171674 RepID=UPI00041DF162|nr:hypothetical protein [Inquilinus limosus]
MNSQQRNHLFQVVMDRLMAHGIKSSSAEVYATDIVARASATWPPSAPPLYRADPNGSVHVVECERCQSSPAAERRP